MGPGEDNLTDNTEVTAWNRWGGQCPFTHYSAYFRNCKSYWSLWVER